jgi:hypothetical protein
MAIASEELEPTFARITGALFKACEDAEPGVSLEMACQCFWLGANALDRVMVCLRCDCDYKDATGVHASLATSNNIRRVSTYIKHKLDLTDEPLFSKDPFWKSH